QGTGKTTKAMQETDNYCMVCHSAMLPADLMEDFKFIDGNPSFTPSALQIAMTNGIKIVLDEINLLPFESLRFLQSVLDGKTEFKYKGKTVCIKEGFQIIGTMNLTVNGCTFALPEPLVDRACELRKYTLTADALIGALI
ncbi:MAG: AAA family ATPase, partial [Acinetobacter sp.]